MAIVRKIKVATAGGADATKFIVRLKSYGPRRLRPFEFSLASGADGKEQSVAFIPAHGAVIVFADPLGQGYGAIEFDFIAGKHTAALVRNARRQVINF